MSTEPHTLDEQVRALDRTSRRVLRHLLARIPLVRDPNVAFEAGLGLGDRAADRLAAFGGSWTFVVLFLTAMGAWIAANALARRAVDPFPFILLNLALSCLAALQAPVIMMSQNRQA